MAVTFAQEVVDDLLDQTRVRKELVVF